MSSASQKQPFQSKLERDIATGHEKEKAQLRDKVRKSEETINELKEEILKLKNENEKFEKMLNIKYEDDEEMCNSIEMINVMSEKMNEDQQTMITRFEKVKPILQSLLIDNYSKAHTDILNKLTNKVFENVRYINELILKPEDENTIGAVPKIALCPFTNNPFIARITINEYMDGMGEDYSYTLRNTYGAFSSLAIELQKSYCCADRGLVGANFCFSQEQYLYDWIEGMSEGEKPETDGFSDLWFPWSSDINASTFHMLESSGGNVVGEHATPEAKEEQIDELLSKQRQCCVGFGCEWHVKITRVYPEEAFYNKLFPFIDECLNELNEYLPTIKNCVEIKSKDEMLTYFKENHLGEWGNELGIDMGEESEYEPSSLEKSIKDEALTYKDFVEMGKTLSNWGDAETKTKYEDGIIYEVAKLCIESDNFRKLLTCIIVDDFYKITRTIGRIQPHAETFDISEMIRRSNFATHLIFMLDFIIKSYEGYGNILIRMKHAGGCDLEAFHNFQYDMSCRIENIENPYREEFFKLRTITCDTCFGDEHKHNYIDMDKMYPMEKELKLPTKSYKDKIHYSANYELTN